MELKQRARADARSQQAWHHDRINYSPGTLPFLTFLNVLHSLELLLSRRE
jgi:hypothetical protein